MIEMVIGALIALFSIGFTQILQYLISTKKEKRQLKIQSITKFKETILKLRIHITELYLGSSEKELTVDSFNLFIELLKLSSDLHTLPETKKLAESVDDLIDDFGNYRKMVRAKKDLKEIDNTREKLRKKIEKLQRQPIY